MTETANARPSSTVVLVRDTTSIPEFLTVRRHAESAFGDSYAFPGGVVDSSDRAVHNYCKGLAAEEADRILDVDANGLDFYSAAIRELFEETGVLLADTEADDLQRARDNLNDGSLRWDEFVAANNVSMQCDAVHYFSHWITPSDLPKRYSARFFTAELPAGQQAVHDDGELTDSCWMTAADVLDAGEKGSMSLRVPTMRTLKSLAGHKSVGEIVEWAKSVAAAGVTCIQPRIVNRDGVRHVILDGDDDSVEFKP